MPTATSPMGNVRSRTVWTYRSVSGLGGSRAERRRSRRQARHASRRSGRGLGRRVRPFRTHADVEI
eukprot:6816744-Prymnesium_polylepis.1